MAASQSGEHFAGSTSKRTIWAVCLLLAMAVFIVFGQTLQYQFVNFDDNVYVYNNPAVINGLTLNGIAWAFTHSHAGYWQPPVWISYMLDAQFYGLNAGGYHFTNVLLHAATAVFLFLVLRKMTGELWPGAFVAAVFAIHPLRVESVAWITERKDVLSGLFFMLTLWAYARHAQKRLAPNSRLWSFDYSLALTFFALGLMSKSMLVTLPFVLLLLDYWPLHRFKTSMIWTLVLEKLPFIFLAAVSGIVTFFTQRSAGALATLESIPLPSRLLNGVLSYAAYIVKMLWPENLAVLYPFHIEMPIGAVILAGALLLFVTAMSVMLGRQLPYLLVGWLWYLGMLVPVIGILQSGQQAMADRYTYLPQIGLYLVIAWAVRDLSVSWCYRRQVLCVAAIGVIAALMLCAFIQTSYWRNSETLWTHELACTSANATAHNNLGNVFAGQDRLADAIKHYQEALAIDPNYAIAHNNLANVLAKQGKTDDAIEHYQRAIQINPEYFDAYYNCGVVLAGQGRLDEAVNQYQLALAVAPNSDRAHYKLGLALADQKNFAAAIAQFQEVLRLNPTHVEARQQLQMLESSAPEPSRP